MLLLVISIVFMLLSLGVGYALKSRFNAYAKIPLSNGMSGKEIAEKMLRDSGIYDVQVTCIPGKLTDHYNPANKTVNLSPEVYEGRSVSSAAVAAHECGHAVQHATAYKFLQFRSAMVPVVSISSRLMSMIFMISIFGAGFLHLFNWDFVLYIIIAAQGSITLFSLITLPVEFDATKRGLAWLETAGVTYGEQHEKAKSALRMAATTYVVAALYAITVLLYFVLRLVASRD